MTSFIPSYFINSRENELYYGLYGATVYQFYAVLYPVNKLIHIFNQYSFPQKCYSYCLKNWKYCKEFESQFMVSFTKFLMHNDKNKE